MRRRALPRNRAVLGRAGLSRLSQSWSQPAAVGRRTSKTCCVGRYGQCSVGRQWSAPIVRSAGWGGKRCVRLHGMVRARGTYVLLGLRATRSACAEKNGRAPCRWGSTARHLRNTLALFSLSIRSVLAESAMRTVVSNCNARAPESLRAGYSLERIRFAKSRSSTPGIPIW